MSSPGTAPALEHGTQMVVSCEQTAVDIWSQRGEYKFVGIISVCGHLASPILIMLIIVTQHDNTTAETRPPQSKHCLYN